jgi:hypothetical protein
LVNFDPLERLERKHKLNNIPCEKKKTHRQGDPPVTHGVYSGKRFNTVSVKERSVSNPYFICIHLSSYNSYQLSITDTRLSIVG